VLIVDVNRTRVHLVYGEDDWRLTPDVTDVEYDRGSLILRRRPFVFAARRAERPPTPDDRRGAGRDRYGNWYWIAPDRLSLEFLGHDTAAPQHFWAATDRPVRCRQSRGGEFFADGEASPRPPRPLAGLAVTTDHYLLAGADAESALLVFDLHAGGPPLELAWPAQAPFTAFDLAPTVDGGAWILDRAHRTYLGVDRHLNFLGAAAARSADPVFMAVDPGAAPASNRAVPDAAVKPFALAGVADPIAIESLPDGSVLVLDVGAGSSSVVHRFLNGERLGDPATLVLSAGGSAALPLRGHDLAFVPDDPKGSGIDGLVYVTAASGNQTFAFRTRPGQLIVIEPEPSYFPMRLAAGKGLVATADGPYYDLDDRWIALAKQPLPRYEVTATLQLPRREERDGRDAFDSRQPRCVWHRLLVDACVPPGTAIRIESRAADDLAALRRDSATPWQAEPALYLRRDGSEIPFYRTPLPGGADHTGTWELLFQRATGRYLQLRMTLTGAGRNTPRVHALRAYYPRFSYLREYLPAIYREDEPSASFLDRFLANIEGFYTAIEGRIEQAQALFDPRTVPAEFLEWLAGWFGVALDPAWDDDKRRLFLAHAHDLFLERGTLGGVTRALRLALDDCADESVFANACACGCDAPSPFTVRISEGFLGRPESAPAGTAADNGGWTADQGAAALHARFAAFLERQYATVERLNDAWSSLFDQFSDVRFEPMRPGQDIRGRDWSVFARTQLSRPYVEAEEADEPLYRRFLGHRYPQVGDLRKAWGFTDPATGPHSFSEVHLPTELPADRKALADWIEFVSSVLLTERRAHYFTVLVPATIDESEATQAARLDLARRVTAAVKPAHTDFNVALYWALFRIGEARVGLDTVLGQGSRFVAIVLGKSALADGYLTARTPGGELDRFITGRDPLRSGPSTRGSVS
jgi:phage tail-like protein